MRGDSIEGSGNAMERLALALEDVLRERVGTASENGIVTIGRLAKAIKTVRDGIIVVDANTAILYDAFNLFLATVLFEDEEKK